jgi:hypothetical protein
MQLVRHNPIRPFPGGMPRDLEDKFNRERDRKVRWGGRLGRCRCGWDEK